MKVIFLYLLRVDMDAAVSCVMVIKPQERLDINIVSSRSWAVWCQVATVVCFLY